MSPPSKLLDLEEPDKVRLCGLTVGDALPAAGWVRGPRGWWAREEPVTVEGEAGTLEVQLDAEGRIAAVQLTIALGDEERALARGLDWPLDLAPWDTVARPSVRQRGDKAQVRTAHRLGWFELVRVERMHFTTEGEPPRSERSFQLARLAERHPNREERRTVREAAERTAIEDLLDRVVGPEPKNK